MSTTNIQMLDDAFYQEYTSPSAILRYTKATAGYGISYLLDNDYKTVYMRALEELPPESKQHGLRILEFGCGAGMNLLHLISILKQTGRHVEKAVGTDFSPELINAAKSESQRYLLPEDQANLAFYVAKNESLITDLSAVMPMDRRKLLNSFDFIIGVNTMRYCHRSDRELNCARDIMHLLAPGGVCVTIDMNNRFPFFRSRLTNVFGRPNEKQCYLPSLEEYAAPFDKTGFELLRKEHFCWIPHSSGLFMCGLLITMAPVLDAVIRPRAMRSLVVARKPFANTREPFAHS